MRGNAGSLRRCIAVAVVAALGTSLVAACTSDDPKPETVASKAGDGGTVEVYMSSLESLDPQRIYVTNGMNVSNLMTRTLTTFKQEDGSEAKLVGDLATDAGTPNGDDTTWTFTLRDGVKWQDGTTVTCQDVRYGTLRNFDVRREGDAEIVGGPMYPQQWLDVPKDYKGPKGGKPDTDVQGVTCKNKRTVVFHMKEPQANFPSAAALPAFSPVPEAADTWAKYGEQPVSNGPYKLASYSPAEDGETGKAVFKRNRFWDSKTDKIRQAKPDKVVVNLGEDPEEVAHQIVSDNPDYDNAVMYGSLPSKYTSQVINDKRLKRQTVEGATSSVRYMTIDTSSVTELDCRRALAYGFNKRKYMDVYGGDAFGEYATTMLPPSDPAHRDFDVYGLGDKPGGDPEKAKELLKETKDCPKSLTLDVEDTERAERLADTIADTYGRLGITVKINTIKGNYFQKLSYPKNSHDLTLSGWAPDWPGGSGVIPTLFDGDAIHNGGNTNYSKLDDSKINDAIDAAAAESDRGKAYEQWGKLDERIQKQAAAVPISFATVLSLCGRDVRGGEVNAQWGGIDIASLGVK